jgi:hypothetical protein
MSLTKVLFASASITVCVASLPCHAALIVPSSSVSLSVPGLYDFRAMIADFTPPGGLTLSAYAAQNGFSTFDWQQQITNWPNPDLQTFNNVPIVPVPPGASFNDPPPTGYTYNPCGGKAPGAAGMANPVYYTVGSGKDCWLLSNNETPSELRFSDEPMDPQLTPTQKSAGNIAKFTTTLVGITVSEGTVSATPVGFSWTWESNFNGSVGGASCLNALCATTANSPALDPGADGPTSCDPGGTFPAPDPLFCGTGGVTITSINGVPFSCHQPPGEPQPGGETCKDPPADVPEPPGLLLLASGMLAILAARRIARSKKGDANLTGAKVDSTVSPVLCVADMAIR